MRLFPALWAFVWLLVPSVARAQRVGVVVGVGDYRFNTFADPARPSETVSFSDLFPACVNDAHGVERALLARGFDRVIVLTDDSASKPTHDNILSALGNLKGSVRELVFYFSGHGSRDEAGKGLILPTDFHGEDASNAIGVDELHRAILDVGAEAASVVLDSCHSGAMIKGFQLTGRRQAKFVRWAGLLRKSGASHFQLEESPSVGADALNGNGGPPASPRVCYLAASRANEVAWVGDSGEESVFTHQLRQMLERSRTWGELHRATAQGVARELSSSDDGEKRNALQQPTLSAGFGARRFFGNRELVDSQTDELSSFFHLNAPDSSRLALEIEYNGRREPVSYVPLHREEAPSELVFWARAKTAGYLVLINKDPTNEVKVLFPRDRNAMSARVGGANLEESPESSGGIRIPSNPANTLKPLKPGVESIKALLFARREDAQVFLDRFGTSGGDRFLLQGLKDIVFNRPLRLEGCVTADISFRTGDDR